MGALSWSLYSCQNDDVVDPETNGSEELFTVTEVPAMKGSVSTPILDGTGTYKTGKHVTVKAKAGATISGFLKSGSGTIGNTYQSGGFACADIDDIHGDWSVSATVETAKITFNAGTGGSIGSPSFVEGEIGESKTGPTATANTGYSFDKWSDGCTSATWSGTISSTDRTVTAEFKKEVTLESYIQFIAGEGGTVNKTTVSGTLGSRYTSCKATPNEGHLFVKWSDGCTEPWWDGRFPEKPGETLKVAATFREKGVYYIGVSGAPGYQSCPISVISGKMIGSGYEEGSVVRLSPVVTWSGTIYYFDNTTPNQKLLGSGPYYDITVIKNEAILIKSTNY